MNKGTVKLVALVAVGAIVALWAINNVNAVAQFVAPKPKA